MPKIFHAKHVQDWINLFLAAILFGSPWLMNFADDRVPALSSMISGVVIAALALAAVFFFAEWEEWMEIGVGAWLIAAPFVLNFTDNPYGYAMHVFIGFLVILMAAWELWEVRHPQLAT